MNFNANCEMLNVIFFKLLFKKFLIVFTLIIMFIFLLKKLYNKFVVINCLVILLFKKLEELGIELQVHECETQVGLSKVTA